MKIVYDQPRGGQTDDTEGHITRALIELGHEVSASGDGDIYLFHKNFNPPAEFTGKTACWYFDKVEWEPAKLRRIPFIKDVLDKADFLFMTDETWAKQNPHPKIRILRQGIGDSTPGKREERNIKVAFVGNPYGGRDEWCLEMMKVYGDSFWIYSHKFNRELNDLCASVPIFSCPRYPSDDYYWSNRVYLLVGSGAFLIHPRLRGLEAEWGDDLVYYDDMADLHSKIKYYLEHAEERELLRQRGYKRCVDNFTYKKRVEALLLEVENEKARK